MKLSDAEWRIMNVIWEKQPTTVRAVFDLVHDKTSWAYTTVKSMMDRLVDKQVLSAIKENNQRIYSALIAKEDARRSAFNRLMENAFDGAIPSFMHHLVAKEKLSEEDIQAMRDLLEEPPQ